MGTPPFDQDPDKERTVIRPLPGAQAHASTALDGQNALPVGTRRAEFEIARVIGEGGFGIVYLARDESLQRMVALKEFMPSTLAARGPRGQVTVRSERHRDTFSLALKSFVNEARLLAQFDHPALVKVHRFWEADGTAYMVMPFYEGITLKDKLAALGAAPDEAWLMAMLDPLTEALAMIHGEHCYHRDISPDNILLLAGSDRPVLLDFGAARRVIEDMTQTLTVILKPGYAPVEQYAEIPGMKQGPWTDVYSLAAVVHFALTGRTPPPAVGRLVHDDYEPLATRFAGRYSPGFLAAIDRALAVRPEARIASMTALRDALGLHGTTSQGTQRTSAPAPVLPVAAAPAASRPASKATQGPSPPSPPARGAGRTKVVLLGSVAGLAVLALLAGTVYLLSRPGQLRKDIASPTLAVAPMPPPVQALEPPPPPPVPVPEPRRFTVDSELERVLEARSADFTVSATPEKATLRVGRDEMKFTVTSIRSGHVFVQALAPDGTLTLLFPNERATDNRIAAGKPLRLPGASWRLVADNPPGEASVLVIVSERPRDFSDLTRGQGGGSLPVGDSLATLARNFSGKGSILAGKATCDAPGCDDYGAALFRVNIVP